MPVTDLFIFKSKQYKEANIAKFVYYEKTQREQHTIWIQYLV